MNLNKKGFTLIEIIAAITIMLILIGVAIPITMNLINNNRQRNHDVHTQQFKSFSRLWLENNDEINTFISVGGRYGVTIAQLRENNYIDEIPINPLTGETFDDNACIIIDGTGGTNTITYTFEAIPTNCPSRPSDLIIQGKAVLSGKRRSSLLHAGYDWNVERYRVDRGIKVELVNRTTNTTIAAVFTDDTPVSANDIDRIYNYRLVVPFWVVPDLKNNHTDGHGKYILRLSRRGTANGQIDSRGNVITGSREESYLNAEILINATNMHLNTTNIAWENRVWLIAGKFDEIDLRNGLNIHRECFRGETLQNLLLQINDRTRITLADVCTVQKHVGRTDAELGTTKFNITGVGHVVDGANFSTMSGLLGMTKFSGILTLTSTRNAITYEVLNGTNPRIRW